MKRLVEELSGSFEARLLASETGAEPSWDAQARALQAAAEVIAAGAATATGAAVATGSSLGRAALTTKLAPGLAWKTWVVGAVMTSAVGTGGVLVVKSATPSSVAPRAPAVEVSARSRSVIPRRAPAEIVESQPLVEQAPESMPTTSRNQRTDRVAAPLPAASSAPPVTPSESNLAGEIRAIDDARSSLNRHNPDEAMAILAEFDRRYPSASLAREAALLRIEALSERGDRGEAVRLAKELLAQSPQGPYKARLRRIIESETSP